LPLLPSTLPHCFTFCDLLNSLGCDEAFITQAALQSGWLKRSPRKITPASLFDAVCFESSHGTASFNDVASRIHTLPSRQAVARRMNKAALVFFQHCLATLIDHKTAASHTPSWLSRYHRIILQDSTVLKLPAWLFDTFSGVTNATTTVCNARIQAVYDLKNRCFLAFSIDAYSKNDLLCAPALKLQKGDLVLRDRGYLLADELQRHLDVGADCIYRHKTGTLYLDPDTRQPIDLLAELRKNGCLDLRVLLNNKAQTPVRLLSAPVSQETAGLRRMKAKKEMRGHAPSEAVLALMDWTVFITTIAAPEADFKTILATYGLRWRVEVLFKSWKSHLNFDLIHRVSKTQLSILLTARLLIITALTNWLHPRCHDLISKVHDRQLSLLKFLHYLAMKPEQLPPLVHCLSLAKPQTQHPLLMLKKYCCYDKRKRQNFDQFCCALP
jgi:hypothetical protein